jgi:hypothetical protein
MAVRHDTNDIYMLQVKVNGNWHDDRKVRKSGGSNTCRVSAKRTGKSYRVVNLSKGKAVYCEIDPT